MADMIIKPSSGNSLVFQDEGGDPALTVGTTGNTTLAGLIITASSAPGSPTTGQVYYNSIDKTLYVYDGTNFRHVSERAGKAIGGTVTSYVKGSTTYVVHTFLESGTFTPYSSFNIDALIVAGGGAAASSTNIPGAGGAGGVLTGYNAGVIATSYTITIGAGGAINSNGGNSIITGNSETLTALGGGRGGDGDGGSNFTGRDGGSGGGSNYKATGGGQATQANGTFGGQTFTGYGYDGAGSIGSAGGYHPGGGGGGAGGSAVRPTNTSDNTADGGIGMLNDFRTGTMEYYAGGGGGAVWSMGAGEHREAPKGGKGGGGDAGSYSGNRFANSNGLPGEENTGGGGGGGAHAGMKGTGGSGIVVIRYSL